MGFLRRLFHHFVFKIVSTSVESEIQRTQRELATEEEHLCVDLARRLRLRRQDVDIKLRPSPNGFLVPKIEFYVEATPWQIAKAQDFLDRLTLSRQNARVVPGMH